MPLLDHFHPPLSKRRHWESFHSCWATHLAGQLNLSPMPAGYIAEPNAKLGVKVGTDVGTFEGEGGDPLPEPPNGAVATADWAPPQPSVVVPVDLADVDVFEVKVYDEDRARTLVAAVELVSPSNKDRPIHRQAFVAKCAAYLQADVSVIVVDVVTSRRHNFHKALLKFLGGNGSAARAVASHLYAVAYRARPAGARLLLEAWPAVLKVGAALPVLPLWLAEDIVVPLDLEGAYRKACQSLAILNG